MPARHAFEYAVVRIVPRVERGEFLNAGVVLYCRTRRFLELRAMVDVERLGLLGAPLDTRAIATLLEHWTLICSGGAAAGELGALTQAERFRWLTAPRSTIVQPSAVHCGMCHDPSTQLDQLFAALVAPPGAPTAPFEPSTAGDYPTCSL